MAKKGSSKEPTTKHSAAKAKKSSKLTLAKIWKTPYHEVIERELVLTRVIEAPPQVVFEAFAQQSAVEKWFGPAGFITQTSEFVFQVGGLWRFIYIAPDGTHYDNRIEYIEIRPPEQIVFYHGTDRDNAPDKFFVTVTFGEQQNGKTVLTMRQLHPTKKQRAGVMGFGAVEFGMQTFDKLVAYLARSK